ncbi:M48 family metallopeptidase [Solwaraspora sp. WMMA2065]|uniref:M48 family metalloprotease n=1 Tax=Solwaraspora sp. WMMA2065 TaxID=3015166 RepID=UPI00259B3FD4|nr:M48 family metallopeptidase [Solwaraspora sp. WMMA2065]WJK37153.1 M48 family metalloprotease [Solwaraspora sp. WMMA2065]
MASTEADAQAAPGEPGQSRAANLYRVPAATTTLFALLVLAVLATAGLIYTSIYTSVPTKGQQLWASVILCKAAEPILARDPDSLNGNEVTWYTDALHRSSLCVAPEWRDEILWAVYGNMLLFAVAVLMYWTYPWFLIRLRGLRKLAPDGPYRQVHGDLVELSEQAGLSSPPTFMLGAGKDVNGQAFGRLGRYYVRLDAGLLDLHGNGRDRERFDAVVLHELGHLYHRDVNKTYLTVTIWWSYVAVAALPLLVLTVHPGILSTPLDWQGPSAGTIGKLAVLLALTVFVLLSRNAVLRARETYADMRVVACGGPVNALRNVIETQQWPLLRGMLSRHPHPTDRVKAVNDPDTMRVRPRLWETATAGFAAAVIAVNLQVLVPTAFPEYPVLSATLAGLICVPAVVGPLGVAVWRATVAARLRTSRGVSGSGGTGRPRWWHIASPAMALTAGFLLGEQTTLISSNRFSLLQWRYLGAVLLLLVGALAVAGWMAAAMHTIGVGTTAARRWSAPLLISTATLAAAPWTALWVAFRDNDALLDVGLYDAPIADVGWYNLLIRWSDIQSGPLHYIAKTPLVLPGLTLLWLVPWLLSRHSGHGAGVRPHPPVRLRPAVITSLVVAAAVALVCLSIAVATGVLLPDEVSDSVGYSVGIFLLAYHTVASMGVACAVGVVTVRARRHWALLVPFTLCLAGVLATLAADAVALPVARCINLAGSADRFVLSCASPLPSDVSLEAYRFHLTIVEGAVLAIPAIMVATAIARIRLLWRARPRRQPEHHATGPDGGPARVPAPREDTADQHPTRTGGAPPELAQPRSDEADHPGQEASTPTRRHHRIPGAPAVGVAILATVTIALTILQAPDLSRTWLGEVLNSKPNRPGVTAKLASVDSCLVGTWRETSRVAYRHIDGTGVWLRSKGRVYEFRDNGTGIIDYGMGVTETGTLHGKPVTVTRTGRVTFWYETRDRMISYSHSAGDGTIIISVAGAVQQRSSLHTDTDTGTGTDTEHYSCLSDDTMRLHTTSTHTNDMRRLSRTPIHAPVPTTPAGDQNCLIGTWTETNHVKYFEGDPTPWTNFGVVRQFKADGTGTVDFGAGSPRSAVRDGLKWQFVITGKSTFRYRTSNGKIVYSEVSGHGSATLIVDAVIRSQDDYQVTEFDPNTYVCQGDTMRLSGPSYSVDLRREP